MWFFGYVLGHLTSQGQLRMTRKIPTADTSGEYVFYHASIYASGAASRFFSSEALRDFF
jgi:hypothetical protein